MCPGYSADERRDERLRLACAGSRQFPLCLSTGAPDISLPAPAVTAPGSATASRNWLRHVGEMGGQRGRKSYKAEAGGQGHLGGGDLPIVAKMSSLWDTGELLDNYGVF